MYKVRDKQDLRNDLNRMFGFSLDTVIDEEWFKLLEKHERLSHDSRNGVSAISRIFYKSMYEFFKDYMLEK